MTYPSGRIVKYNYDSSGRLADKDATNPAFSGNLGDGVQRTYASEFEYTAMGGVQQEKFGTATPLYHKQQFNQRGQLWDMRLSTVSFATDPANGDRGAIVNYYSNNFVVGGSNQHNNGNLLRQAVNIPGNGYFQQDYLYDTLNRLTSVAEKRNGTTETFKQTNNYDRYGNRTIRTNATETFGGVNNLSFELDTTAAAKNRLYAPGDLALSESQRRMQYDPAGNLTRDTYTGAGDRSYDAENRMTKAWGGNGQWQEYSYNGDGQRARRKVDGVETWQVYGLGGELLAEYAANTGYATPQKEYGYRNGQLLVTVGIAGEVPVSWNKDSKVKVTASGNSLTKTASGLSAWNAGASSEQSIASGDGYMEFTASETNKARAAGLNKGDANQNWTDIDYCVQLDASGNVSISEGATTRGTFGTYASGDRFRVGVEGGVVKYRKNGTLLYTSTVTPGYPLLVDTSLYTNGATINNVVTYGTDLRWLATDQLGTPRIVVDQSGSLATTKRHDYLPFGEELFEGTGGRTGAMGYSAADGVRQKFTGYEHDGETGLEFAHARYYGSSQGRFTSTAS